MDATLRVGRVIWFLLSALLWAIISLCLLAILVPQVAIPLSDPSNALKYPAELVSLLTTVGAIAVVAIGAFWLGWLTPRNARFKWPRRILGYIITFGVLGFIALFLIIGLAGLAEMGT